MDKFDTLIREGKDTDALRLMAQQYYDNGRMGYTRKLLLERVADKCEVLQGQFAVRDKGCDHCRERKPILDELGNLQIDDIDSSLWFTYQAAADDIYEEHTDIKFCPMCGRKLGEQK